MQHVCEGRGRFGAESGPSEPDTTESLRVMAYEMVCGALKAVTKEDKTQLGLSGNAHPRSTGHRHPSAEIHDREKFGYIYDKFFVVWEVWKCM